MKEEAQYLANEYRNPQRINDSVYMHIIDMYFVSYRISSISGGLEHVTFVWVDVINSSQGREKGITTR